MDTNEDFLKELLYFSSTVCNIPLNKTSIQTIIYLDNDDFLQPKFSDKNSFFMQNCLLEAKDNSIKIILKNLSKAIELNCSNNIDLKTIIVPENFSYKVRVNLKESSISKKYKDYEIMPKNEIEFKKVWLKTFISELKKIDLTIRYILDLPKTEYESMENNMIADNEHYQNHWEFFKSVNPKADEVFFIELELNKLQKRIKKTTKEIDFSNDATDTIEGHVNDLKRKDFFFHKEYIEFLKEKLIEIKNRKELKTLPPLEQSIIIHYGCSDFKNNEHKIYWIGAISHEPNKTYFFENKNEIEIIEKLFNYIENNQNKTFIHWSMNSPKYGFSAIGCRYYELTKGISIMPKNEIDLSEYLKNKYGINYIDRQNGRLNNLAILNDFSGLQSEVEVININDATNRLELLFSIVQAEIQGNLKTNKTLPPQPNIETLPTQQFSTNESKTKKIISETLTNIDKQGWQYAFVSEQDYNLFTNLLTNFFEYKPYTLPETKIQLKRTCKTKVAKALGEIHKELSNENKLISDTDYFNLIRVLSHFKNEKEGVLYKALTR